MEIQTERVEIPLDGGGSMGGYLARPAEGDEHPAILVFMEIFGINSHIRDITERIAGEGYVALAPDYFHRTGPGVELAYDDAGMAEGMKMLGALTADEMRIELVLLCMLDPGLILRQLLFGSNDINDARLDKSGLIFDLCVEPAPDS